VHAAVPLERSPQRPEDTRRREEPVHEDHDHVAGRDVARHDVTQVAM